MKSRVYRNLNTGLWSIQQKQGATWQVVGHAKWCTLMDVKVRQSEAARQKVLREQCRSVHCWATGYLIGCSPEAGFKGREPSVATLFQDPPAEDFKRIVTYNPYKHATLVYEDDNSEYRGSRFAYFSSTQKMLVTRL